MEAVDTDEQHLLYFTFVPVALAVTVAIHRTRRG
jgi:hypothetical protein